jgi:hypothetical protein
MEFARRSEFLYPPRIAVIGSQAHFAVDHFLGLVVFRTRIPVEAD